VSVAAKTAPPIAKLSARFNGATETQTVSDLSALPDWLDRIDGYIADGVIGGDPPNAADLQIATSVALLMTLDDLRPFIEDRPAGQLARRLDPEFPGRTPAGYPDAWLEPLRQATGP
jgi:glutathione S-transferase